MLDGLLGAWIDVAAGDPDAAKATFATLAETEGFAPFAWLHEAYALASTGDYAGADEIFSGRAHGPLEANTRGITAHAEVLMQLGRKDDALDLLRQANAKSNSPMLEDLEARIEAGEEIPYGLIDTPVDGMAEAYFMLAAILVNDSSTTYTLLNARAATVLRPDHVDALILVSDLLESQGEHDLAERGADGGAA